MTSLNRPTVDLIEWINLPFINIAQVCKDTGITKSRMSKCLKGKQQFTAAQLSQLNGAHRLYITQMQRASEVKNKPLKSNENA